MEQLQAQVQPKQATPFFSDKLDRLVTHTERSMESSSISPTQRFILARDEVYFKVVFFSGDRPGDMGQVKVPEILRFPNNDGFLFHHIWGKTVCGTDTPKFLEHNDTLRQSFAQFGVSSSTWLFQSNLRSTSGVATYFVQQTPKEP